MTARKLLKLSVFLILAVSAIEAISYAADPSGGKADQPAVYVPYSALQAVLEKSPHAVLMDRKAFAKLLGQAKANVDAQPGIELAQVVRADYTAEADTEKVKLTGKIEIESMTQRAVAVPLAFGQIGITKITLDKSPAPLGFDKTGRLVVIVIGKGKHTMKLTATFGLKELSDGGQQFTVTLPEATAGTMKLSALGDLEIHSTAPVSDRKYDKNSDRTTGILTLGGQSTLAVALMGNGRGDEARAIMLGSTAESVQIDETYQSLSCLATVHVLRRGVGELKFRLPADWTVTDVASPDMVKWSVAPVKKDVKGERKDKPQQKDQKILTVRLRNSRRGTHNIHIKAGSSQSGKHWNAPRISLIGAEFSKGNLRVTIGENLRVRRETLKNARREDSPMGGRVYLHWDQKWTVGLDLTSVKLRQSCKVRQQLTVSPQQLTLDGQFEVTAIGRELFSLAFELPSEKTGFNLKNLGAVTVNGSTKGFEYRVTKQSGKKMLKIELARPVEPEAVANVRIVMQHTPADWNWQRHLKPRDLAIPRIIVRTDSVDGLLSLKAADDLTVETLKTTTGLKLLPVGRMASLGLGREIQQAYSYDGSTPAEAMLEIRVSRQKARLRCDAVGLVSAKPSKLVGQWRLDFDISRASTRKLRFLAAKSLGREINIVVPGRQLAGEGEIVPSEKQTPADYNTWLLTLDSPARGKVSVFVSYEISAEAGKLVVPLVRSGMSECSEVLAVQASDQIAVKIDSVAMREIDTIELPPLPARAGRLLSAYRLVTLAEKTGRDVSLTLQTTVHKHYKIPVAIAGLCELKTYIGNDGAQQTAATFRIANAGLQFLRFRLPEGADLWSVRVGKNQAKPIGGLNGEYQVVLPLAKKPLPVRIVYASPGDPNQSLDTSQSPCLSSSDSRSSSNAWPVPSNG